MVFCTAILKPCEASTSMLTKHCLFTEGDGKNQQTIHGYAQKAEMATGESFKLSTSRFTNCLEARLVDTRIRL